MPVYNHIGLAVHDLERSKRFYRRVLGFDIWYEDSIPDEATVKLLGLDPPLDVRVAYMVLDGCVLELLHFGAPGAQAPWRRRSMNEPGLTHLSISVDDIRATAKRATEEGGEIIESSDLGIALLIRDPDGQILELLSSDYPSRRPPRPAPPSVSR